MIWYRRSPESAAAGPKGIRPRLGMIPFAGSDSAGVRMRRRPGLPFRAADLSQRIRKLGLCAMTKAITAPALVKFSRQPAASSRACGRRGLSIMRASMELAAKHLVMTSDAAKLFLDDLYQDLAAALRRLFRLADGEPRQVPGAFPEENRR